MTGSNPYRGFRHPAEVIQHAVRLYRCFSLSLRDVELTVCTLVRDGNTVLRALEHDLMGLLHVELLFAEPGEA